MAPAHFPPAIDAGSAHSVLPADGYQSPEFYYWRKRLREMDAASSGPPITTSGSLHQQALWPETQPPTSCRYQLSAAARPTELEIELANGCVVRLKGAVDGDLLQAAISAAGELNGRGDH